ncbi:hypothetical protein [Campylobacter troglodytis]|uniref:hypothetical protein n=1 Tax=Campylobacter troglodytis TaxID=654363 RepID=UPI001157A3E2|nr:hypothetical protein [Campylobacter troglodytis]TQR60502.1 hypothetical protein DMC01_05420 [Campylobacter troglodytis]
MHFVISHRNEISQNADICHTKHCELSKKLKKRCFCYGYTLQPVGSPFYKKAQNDKMSKNSHETLNYLLKIHANFKQNREFFGIC